MIFKKLETERKKYGSLSFALIDPDLKNDNKLPRIVDNINKSGFNAILVGGSHIVDNKFEDRLDYIKSNTNLPIILFPGSSSQVSPKADAILFLSLLSGRNPKFLIEEQVRSALSIFNNNLEVIPTGYLLLQTDRVSAVEKISQTKPLSMKDLDLIKSHGLAAQYLGKKLLFLEAGSNSNSSVNPLIIKSISKCLDIPLMVGGGIKNVETAKKIVESGASYLVIGSLIEEMDDYRVLEDINEVIHQSH